MVFTKNFVFTYSFLRFKCIFYSKGMKAIETIKITMDLEVIRLNNAVRVFTAT